jgi:putative ABC transport system ATP-binding protein
VIELKNINKIFNRGEVNEVKALSDVSLFLQKGEFTIIVGSNGSGKTTLLNIISGAETCSSGAILINGTDVTKLAEYKRSKWIARVFQNPLSGSAPDLSILDNFRLAALRTSRKKLRIGVNAAFKKQVQEKISTLGMGLENKVEQAMGTLSGGQRQALTLVMGTMDHADVLLLDEPTAALDPRSAQVIMNTAKDLIKQYQLTAILITHNLKDAATYGTRLIQMQEGKIIKDIDGAEKSRLQIQDLANWFA